MGRGKLLKTKVKAEKALTKARLQAKKEWENRKSNFTYQLKKEIVNALRNIDYVELAAVGGLTVVIHGVLATTEDVFLTLGKITKEYGPLWMSGTFSGFIASWIWKFLPVEPPEELLPEHLTWIISFVIAYIIIKHPEVMTEMFSGATKLTGFALGLLK